MYDATTLWFLVGNGGVGNWDYDKGTLRYCHRDPFPHSLLRTRLQVRHRVFASGFSDWR